MQIEKYKEENTVNETDRSNRRIPSCIKVYMHKKRTQRQSVFQYSNHLIRK